MLSTSRVDRNLSAMKQVMGLCNGMNVQLVSLIHMLSYNLPVTTPDGDQPLEDR